MLLLSEINIYPVKSLGGISLSESVVEDRGLKHDRRYMLIDETGMFFTQRDYPQLALLNVSLNEKKLLISDKKDESNFIKIHFDEEEEATEVIIWDDKVNAKTVSKNADQFFSDYLNFKCKLVKMPESTNRIVDTNYAENKTVSFADGFPFLLIGQASLDDLNSRMEKPLPMNRFRTNFVVAGGKPFEEDNWNDFKIGNVKFKAVKQCGRCVITTTDQQTAERGKEPLKTLATYRKVGDKVMFGMNLIAESTGKIQLNDEIKLL